MLPIMVIIILNIIDVENIESILEKVQINEVWGVGKQMSKFYIKNG